MKSTNFALAVLLAASASAPVRAQKNTLQIGFLNVQPHSSASDFSGPFTPGGISIDVRDKSTAFISISREITDHWDVELSLGVPPTHDIGLKIDNATLPASSQALSGQVGAKVRQVAPTLFANYRFLDKTSSFRPFVGIGVNYTHFDHTSSNTAGNALNGGATSIALEDSVGVALHGGVVYHFNPLWSLSASVATAQVKSKITTNTLGIERRADITFKPTVYSVAVGYSF